MESRHSASVIRFSFVNPDLFVSGSSSKWAAVEIWVREPHRSISSVRWEVSGRWIHQAPISNKDLRSARRWSRRLTFGELELANEFME